MVHTRLSSTLSPGELDEFIRGVNVECRGKELKLRMRKNKKITSLLNQEARVRGEENLNGGEIQKFQPRVINCTQVEFSREEASLLERGLKFALPSRVIRRHWLML
jgi:hypothetical protein